MSIKLPDSGITPFLAAASSYTSAATALTIPTSGKPWARAVFRHTGTSGAWYGCYQGGTPTTSSYDFILGPGEPEQRDNPPTGAVKLLASGSSIGSLSISAYWAS